MSWLGGRPIGAIGPYEKLQGRVYFAVDPNSPANRRITDLSLASRNAGGLVEFFSDFVVVRPADHSKARNSVVLEVPNRGSTQANTIFFSTGKGAVPQSEFKLLNLDKVSLSDAFIFEQGFTVAWLGWQFDLPQSEIRVEVPSAKATGLVRYAIIPNAAEAASHAVTLSGPSSYCAADAIQTDAKLLEKAHFDDLGQALPRSSWSLAREENGKVIADPCSLLFHQGLKEGRLYEFVYQGANPPLAGLGLAALRDFVSYLKFGGVTSSLREHPGTIQHVLGYGYSQSARLLRDFLYQGFNADEHGKRVFDGVVIASAGAGRGSFNHRYALPGEAGNSVLSDLRPVDMFPFTDGREDDLVQGIHGGLLHAEEESHTVPKVFYTYSSTEYWARVGSLAYTTVDGTRELPLSRSSRLYFYPGTPHDPGPFPPEKMVGGAQFTSFTNFARPGWAFRALLLALDDWVSRGIQPPASAYPHFKNQLVRREQVNFPKIPGVEFPAYMPRNWRVDYGHDFLAKGIIANEPPKLQAPYTVLVPQVNRDGNDLGGIALPDVSVPLGTFTGWNYELPVLSNFDYLAGLRGSFIPFPVTIHDRNASGDPRLSVSERYNSRDEYLRQVRAAAQSLVSRRLLRAEDVDAILEESGERWDYLTSSRRQNKL
jgi:hypothetical protein